MSKKARRIKQLESELSASSRSYELALEYALDAQDQVHEEMQAAAEHVTAIRDYLAAVKGGQATLLDVAKLEVSMEKDWS